MKTVKDLCYEISHPKTIHTLNNVIGDGTINSLKENFNDKKIHVFNMAMVSVSDLEDFKHDNCDIIIFDSMQRAHSETTNFINEKGEELFFGKTKIFLTNRSVDELSREEHAKYIIDRLKGETTDSDVKEMIIGVLGRFF